MATSLTSYLDTVIPETPASEEAGDVAPASTEESVALEEPEKSEAQGMLETCACINYMTNGQRTNRRIRP